MFGTLVDGFRMSVVWAVFGAMPLVSAAGSAPATDDAAVKRGRLLFLQCAACHDIASASSEDGEDSMRKVGPSLHGVVGRRAASVAGYIYSESLQTSGLTWNRANLSRWLEKPAALVPGTSMAYVGMPSEPDRLAVIRYLESTARP